MSYSLNSLRGEYIGTIIRFTKVDARSLHNSSYGLLSFPYVQQPDFFQVQSPYFWGSSWSQGVGFV